MQERCIVPCFVADTGRDMRKQGKPINQRLKSLLFVLCKIGTAVFCEYDG